MDKIKRICVKANDIIYVCQPDDLGFVCGHCFRGRIMRWGEKANGCEVCGAKLDAVEIIDNDNAVAVDDHKLNGRSNETEFIESVGKIP